MVDSNVPAAGELAASSSDELARLRARIDVIDTEMVQLLVQRFVVAQEVGYHKAERGIAVSDPSREGQVLSRLERLIAEMPDMASGEAIGEKTCGERRAGGAISVELVQRAVKEVYAAIFSASKNFQNR